MGYVDANGQLQKVEYIADGAGFRVADSRLPVFNPDLPSLHRCCTHLQPRTPCCPQSTPVLPLHQLLTPLRLLRPRLPMLLPMLLLPLLLTERSVKLTPQSLEEPQLSSLPQPL